MKRIIAIITAFMAIPFLASASAKEEHIVSSGAEYTILSSTSAAFPDSGNKLTDGFYGTVPENGSKYYADGRYVGFNRNNYGIGGKIVMIVDLGEEYADLSAFSIGYLHDPASGIYAPSTVDFEVSSARNGEYYPIGTLVTARPSDTQTNVVRSTLSADPTEGRYVRVTVNANPPSGTRNPYSGWILLDEITVVSASDETLSDESVDEGDNSGSGSGADKSGQPQTGDYGTSIPALGFACVCAAALAYALFSKRGKDSSQ